MKTPLGIALAAGGLAVGAGVALLFCFNEPNSGIIFRATSQDVDDHHWQEVTKVFTLPVTNEHADSRDQLFRIREYKRDPSGGIAATETGSLPLGEMIEDRQNVIAGLPADFVGHVFQVGVGGIQRSQRLPANGKLTPHAHYQQNILESRDMVKAVNAALSAP